MPISQRLSIPNADGHLLAARLETPDAGAPVAYALFAHCFTCSKDLRAVRQISSALAAQGVGVLSVDFTGLGQSEGAFEDTSFSSTVGDLLAAAAHLGETHAAPQMLVGHSLGGAAVLAAAAHLPSVRAIATIGAPCDPGHVRNLLSDSEAAIEEAGSARVDIGGRPFTIRQQFLDDLDSHAMMRERIGALGRALLVFHSPQDRTVGIDQARHIFEAARHPKSFVSLDGADHLLSDPADARYVADVLAAWAGRYLCPSEPEPAANYDDDPTVTATIGASGFRTVLAARGFTIVADEPARVGGTETGPTPYDLLGMALGACTSMTLRMYADRKGLALKGVVTEVSHAKVHADDCAHCATSTGHLDRLTRTIRLDGDLTDEQRQRLLEIADRCPVHRTLEGEIDVVTVSSSPHETVS
ncbi:alpha/beta fold hydrolase [Rubrivirga sp. IMCC43871]|uniref:bifunctional alpha/beta hydrolase/OsmC family protein n=1 Tax=Rubrivirga sp. IMCC43871 TaxID=3391575 RepID=UPI00398FC0AC